MVPTKVYQDAIWQLISDLGGHVYLTQTPMATIIHDLQRFMLPASQGSFSYLVANEIYAWVWMNATVRNMRKLNATNVFQLDQQSKSTSLPVAPHDQVSLHGQTLTNPLREARARLDLELQAHLRAPEQPNAAPGAPDSLPIPPGTSTHSRDRRTHGSATRPHLLKSTRTDVETSAGSHISTLPVANGANLADSPGIDNSSHIVSNPSIASSSSAARRAKIIQHEYTDLEDRVIRHCHQVYEDDQSTFRTQTRIPRTHRRIHLNQDVSQRPRLAYVGPEPLQPPDRGSRCAQQCRWTGADRHGVWLTPGHHALLASVAVACQARCPSTAAAAVVIGPVQPRQVVESDDGDGDEAAKDEHEGTQVVAGKKEKEIAM